MDHLIIGTAGHVDHGKTVLISALTGVDTDRLQEEKQRGISIDLGFAPFRLPSGRLAGVVDVPGHERFIHNMLAGASGLDLVMLVVDATEGVMPQTREHLDILQLLGISNGIVVITKIDLVEEEWRELVEDEIKDELKGSFLENAPIQAVSAISGQGIEELKAIIDRMTGDLEPRNASGPLRLPVDRAFVISGFGTVVTGTLVQGTIRVGQIVDVVPPGLEARVRNVQVHDQDVEEAQAGSRVALNLSGVGKGEIMRGSVVSTPGYYKETNLLDAWVKLLPGSPRSLKNLDPVHFFLGTVRTVANLLLLDRDQVKPGENVLVQCRLEKPLVAERGDPFVIRSYSPMTTIGGGLVLDPYPARHRRFRQDVIKHLMELKQDPAQGGDAAFVKSKLEALIAADPARLMKETRLGQERTNAILEDMLAQGQVTKIGAAYMLSSTLRKLEELLLSELKLFHDKYTLSPGISKARLRGFLPRDFGQQEYDAFLIRLEQENKISVKNDLVSLFNFSPVPSATEQNIIDNLATLYLKGGLQPPSSKEALDKARAEVSRKDEYYHYLQSNAILVKVSDDLYFHRTAYDKALELLRNHFKDQKALTLAQFRDLAGTSRKYAQALLEHFDQQKLTRRVEDHRVALRLK